MGLQKAAVSFRMASDASDHLDIASRLLLRQILSKEVGDSVETARHRHTGLGVQGVAHLAVRTGAVETAGCIHTAVRATAVLLRAFVNVCNGLIGVKKVLHTGKRG